MLLKAYPWVSLSGRSNLAGRTFWYGSLYTLWALLGNLWPPKVENHVFVFQIYSEDEGGWQLATWQLTSSRYDHCAAALRSDDKKEHKIFFIYKAIQKEAHIWLTASSWLNICAFPHILGSPSSYMTLQPLPSEFPYIQCMRKILFSFLTVCKLHSNSVVFEDLLNLSDQRVPQRSLRRICTFYFRGWQVYAETLLDCGVCTE